MKKIILVSLLSVFSLISNAAIINESTPIPNDNILINFNNSGLDWVYAGPIAPNEFGLGNIQVPSFRASEGWRFASVGEWESKPSWTDFIKSGFTIVDVPAQGGWNDHTKYKFASEYWGNFSHVDLNDASEGRITNGFDIGSLSDVYETWYIRNSVVAVPEPETYAMLLAGLGLIGFMTRRRKEDQV
ncbi:PEP-CTERM sorting domain-containing protein [Methylotenera sp.]|uniref:PEP-CTERM sorting domain-containing protein n=1 Tax=Methylotenera sp. TaxID=2051956 RepID=UPI0027319471|nr:PEP-CTERM sorting domain-containing protein [Methylotenera sp.]MDP2230652.1 PEPxxWA-CTERM sorting domain-containing protein [Methylotenera sp.]MDP3140654.1 PEPxxWA-CTERM sorting domain-containing protein [Methylotenera sp.]